VNDPCTHLNKINPKASIANGCEECLAIGDTWVHLRLCLTCGHLGCCDSSKNKHATKHFHTTQHPIVQSFEPVLHRQYVRLSAMFNFPSSCQHNPNYS
jgi:uncharacterized UBP type Zn finger protein